MKDIVKFTLIFAGIYILWRLFWHSVFIAWDLFGLVGLVLFLGFLWHVGRKLLGTLDNQIPARRPAETTLPLANEGPVDNFSNAASSTRDPFPLPLTEDYVTLVGRVQELEFRCSKVWQRGLEQRRNYRKVRHESIAAARHLLEIEQETAVLDGVLVNDIDAFMNGLCAVYLATDSELRLEIRGLLESNPRLLGNVYNYSGRAAAELKQTGKPLFLLRGLLAASIDNNSSHRDWEWILGDLYLASSQKRIDPVPYFKFVAGLSSNEPDGLRSMLAGFQDTNHYRTYVLSRLQEKAGKSTDVDAKRLKRERATG